jgi:hypothetical protein
LEKTIELVKSMEEMKLQESKISRLKRRLRTFRNSSVLTKASYSKEKQTSDKLKQELQQLQKKIVVGKTLAEVKENV